MFWFKNPTKIQQNYSSCCGEPLQFLLLGRKSFQLASSAGIHTYHNNLPMAAASASNVHVKHQYFTGMARFTPVPPPLLPFLLSLHPPFPLSSRVCRAARNRHPPFRYAQTCWSTLIVAARRTCKQSWAALNQQGGEGRWPWWRARDRWGTLDEKRRSLLSLFIINGQIKAPSITSNK